MMIVGVSLFDLGVCFEVVWFLGRSNGLVVEFAVSV